MDEDRMVRILAYVDGELLAEEARAFEREMGADPALAAEVAEHRTLRGQISGAFAPVLEEPVPARLAMMAGAANDRGARRWAPWMAAAAALVVGVFVGRVGMPRGDIVQTGGGGLVARGELARTLTSSLAADQGPVRIGLTFKAGDGRWCRTFQTTADQLAGVACRDQARWRVELATAAGSASSPQYRTAGSETPRAVLEAVDQLRAGETADATVEKQARDNGWR